MFQTLLQFLSVIMLGTIAYFAFVSGILIKNSCGFVCRDLKWIIERTAALDAFLVFSISSFILSSIKLSNLKQISNHIVLSLDILFSINTLIVILFHKFKVADTLLVKNS